MDSAGLGAAVAGGAPATFFADDDAVADGGCSGQLGQPRGGSLVLADVGGSFEDGDAVFDADTESVFVDLGAREAASNAEFDSVIGVVPVRGVSRMRGRRGVLPPERHQGGGQETDQDWNGHFNLIVRSGRYNSHMTSERFARREFLSGAGKSAAALTAASYARVLGANDKMNLGVIGPGVRGRHVMSLFQKTGQVNVTALCDIYAYQLDKALELAPGAKTYTDHRKLLEHPDLDVVLIAVPDQWHAVIAIDALNSGHDVYVEKPLTRTIAEGPPIVKAARVNKRVCQVGMQQRSGPHYLEAKEKYVDPGRLGKVTLARTWWYGNSYHTRKAPDFLQKQPSNMDWAHFLGPLKWRDYDPQQYWNWRAYLDFGGGQVTDLFTHWIDVVHMFLEDEIPKSAAAAGGVYYYKDGRTAPDTINVLLEYPTEFTATFEATLVPGIKGAALELIGSEGSLWISRSKYVFTPVGKKAVPVTVVPNYDVDFTIDHVKNFLDCVRTRKRPNGDVLIGHRSAQASHLGNISYVQKRRLDFDPVREAILPL